MNSKVQRGGGQEIKLPPGIHSLDSHGNIFASLPEVSRVTPKYFTLEQIKEAFQSGKLTTLSEEHIQELEGMIAARS